MSIFEATSVLLVLSAVFGFVNRYFFQLPNAVGFLLLGLLSSLSLVSVEFLFPQVTLYAEVETALKQIDFTSLLFDGMLAFLLFAGALRINISALRRRGAGVAYLALAGTAVSTLITGALFWWVCSLLDLPVPFLWALVFGALISPTDPVGVLSLLKNVDIPAEIKTEAEGESLLNDGVAVVLFALLAGFAAGRETFTLQLLAIDFFREAVGGVALGLATGYLAYQALRRIDDFPVEVLITLALVAGTYALAQRLGASGPLATVAAGLLVGHRAPADAMSDETSRYVGALWTLIDEVLNAVLFSLIGLEVVVLAGGAAMWIAAVAAIPIVLLARLLSVALPMFLPLGLVHRRVNIPFLTWAGIRGGVSIALALSLPASDAKANVLSATYVVVLFSIVVQGLSLPLVARWLGLAARD